MVEINNFIGQNDNISIVEQKGKFTVIQHSKELSVSENESATKCCTRPFDCTKRQLVIECSDRAIKLNPGAVQFMTGTIAMHAGIKGVNDLVEKAVKSTVIRGNAIKPVYYGLGTIICKPTSDHLIIVNISDWDGGVVCSDKTFVACDGLIEDAVSIRSDLGSTVTGLEGLFGLCLRGSGYAVIKSKCSYDDLYCVVLDNDTVKVDGDLAVCWSESLQFTVEKPGPSLFSPVTSGEGMVKVYRGSGKILLAPGV